MSGDNSMFSELSSGVYTAGKKPLKSSDFDSLVQFCVSASCQQRLFSTYAPTSSHFLYWTRVRSGHGSVCGIKELHGFRLSFHKYGCRLKYNSPYLFLHSVGKFTLLLGAMKTVYKL